MDESFREKLFDRLLTYCGVLKFRMSEFDVLITGGAGFIGSAIARYLLSVGKTVVCLDREDIGRLTDIDTRVHQVVGDILDAELMDTWIARCGRVIHLAALVGVDEYVTRPHEVLDVNILGTRNVLMACLKHDRPVLIASSSETYGLNTGILEEDSDRHYGSSRNHRWSYAISKTAGEHYAYALGRLGLTSAAVRYFNIYGPQLDAPGKGRVISKFLGCIRDGKPLTLVDGGHAVRTLCYIDDAAEATARLALELSPDCSYKHSAVNIGRPEPMTMRELAAVMIRLSGHQAGTVEVPGTEFFGEGFEEIPVRVPDVSKLEQVLNFTAKVGTEEGLRRTLDHWGLLAAEDSTTTIAPSPSVAQQIVPMVKPNFAPDGVLMRSFYKSLVTGQATNGGPHLRSFEEELADYLGVPDVVALSNGADALTLGLQLLNRTGKVVLPSYTFIATLNSIVTAGFEPVFCDIDPETFTMSPAALAEILDREENVACVVPVNVFGVAPDLAAISALCKAVGAEIVYDNCHGFGTEIQGQRVPDEPKLQMFSFHATKVLPAIEGGALVSADLDLLQAARQQRNHGIASYDLRRSTLGMNAKMDELRAATGRHVLRRFPPLLEQRRGYAQQLRSFFTESCHGALVPQRIPAGIHSNFQNLGVLFPAAEQFGLEKAIDTLRSNGVECRSYFNPALHCLDLFQDRYHLPVTERIWKSLLCFPIHSEMSDRDLQRIQEAAQATVESLALQPIQ